jgi:plasmid stabilization system protein ParE
LEEDRRSVRIRFTPRARGDVDQIYEYLNERSPSGARNVLLAIHAGVQFVAERPKGSEQTDDPTVRVKVVRRYRYKIFYSIIGETVEILHVRHTSREPWKGKL